MFNTNITVNVETLDNGFLVHMSKSQYDPKAYTFEAEEAAEAPKPVNFRGYCADEAAVKTAVKNFFEEHSAL